MRRDLLPPARPVSLDTGATWYPIIAGGREADSRRRLTRDPLAAPVAARPRLRYLFDPARGWFRRLERRLSHFLSRRVYPRIPGLHHPYDRQLERGLTLSEACIPLRGLPRPFDGLRLLLVTDVHAGPFLSARTLERCFARLMRLRPDLILLGGDLVLSRLEELATHRRAFESLHAPLGVHAVLGNHDHYTRHPSRMRRHLREAGIRVLHNRAIELRRGAATLDLAGVDDLLAGEPDLNAALAGTREPTILLSHNPDLLFDASHRGVALLLSGHTHAGQIRAPGLPVLVRQSRFRLDQGRFRAGCTELVVSRGLGAVGLPLRLGCPPEAVLLTLTAGPASSSASSSNSGSSGGMPRAALTCQDHNSDHLT